MDVKICKECKQLKCKSEFPFTSKEKTVVRPHCKDCYKKIRRKHYSENKEKKREENRKSYLKHREKRIKQTIEYQKSNVDKARVWRKTAMDKAANEFNEFKKTLSCVECGENDPVCLDFHHVDPDSKKYLITKIRRSRGILQEELKKCIVLCANCHRKYHRKIENNDYV